MPKFVTIGYGDRAGYDRTAPAVRDAAHTHDAALREGGALMGVAGQPVQVRNPDGLGIETTNGPFLSSALPVAGFSIIDAASLEDAIEIVAKTPCAVAHGVVEVWPLDPTP
ncbi:MAG: YciI family protein [Paracoccaceae bacterium]